MEPAVSAHAPKKATFKGFPLSGTLFHFLSLRAQTACQRKPRSTAGTTTHQVTNLRVWSKQPATAQNYLYDVQRSRPHSNTGAQSVVLLTATLSFGSWCRTQIHAQHRRHSVTRAWCAIAKYYFTTSTDRIDSLRSYHCSSCCCYDYYRCYCDCYQN